MKLYYRLVTDKGKKKTDGQLAVWTRSLKLREQLIFMMSYLFIQFDLNKNTV